MQQKIRCQSCGMPLDEGFFGTLAGGAITRDYCRFCYVEGQFTEPEMTMDLMIQRNIDFMVRKLKMPEDKSKEWSYMLMPTLSRWKKESEI